MSFLSPILQRPDVRHLLVDARSGTVLARSIEIALDSRSRRRGLLGRTEMAPGSAMVIAPCSAIHTFFMRFPIDVAFVKKDGRVARAYGAVAPWRMRGALGGYAALEFPAGTLAAGGVRTGDQLVLVPEEGRAPGAGGSRERDAGQAGGEGAAGLDPDEGPGSAQ
jgi:uncharacterized membrane protein (UPF0127 family)